MNRSLVQAAVCACTLFLAGAVRAEESGEETPDAERKAKQAQLEPLPAAEDFIAYMQDLDKRYPDSERVDEGKLLEEEGEKIALLYCRALGSDGPCIPDDSPKGFSSAAAQRGGFWWDWIRSLFMTVGVVPEAMGCPSSYPFVQIYMDDEDRRNANSRWGWIGATTSTNNTTWRFCRIPGPLAYQSFRPLKPAGAAYGYAVLSLGILCPPGSRRVIRHEDNEDWNNQNASSGNVFPNFKVFNWTVFTCHFDGGTYSSQMAAFPDLGMKYGVFAATNMPWPYALQNGSVSQDDEDFLNINFWIGNPSPAMGGGGNTWRGLAKVK